jgi:hypothetical protein
MGESSSINARSFIIIFFILAVGFSLMSAGIFKDNTAIGIVAYATKSKESSGGGSSDSGGGGSSGGSSGSRVMGEEVAVIKAATMEAVVQAEIIIQQ